MRKSRRNRSGEEFEMFMRKICGLMILVLLMTICLSGNAETQRVSSLEEFAARVQEHTGRLETFFTVSCDPALIQELKRKSDIGKDTTFLSEIMKQAGISGPFSITWYDDSVMLHELDYYPGWRLWHLWERGDLNALSAREKQLLDAARALVSGAAGSDLEKERIIYDTLCARVTYEKEDDGSGDKDNAIGALLNGRADCDGYADAMLLCCSLAGIPCRYINGEGIKPDQQSKTAEERQHMWNLVFIHDSWLMCDVTWGDQDQKEPDYLYFNIGSQDASASYKWDSETLFTPVAPIADFPNQLMPDQQPETCRTFEEVYQAACKTTTAGKRHLLLFCPEEKLWETDRNIFSSMLYHGAIGNYSYGDSGRLFSVYNIMPPETPFCFCESKEEAISAIQAYADAGVHSFALYFHPDVSKSLFANDHAELGQILGESCLEESGRYSYSEESGRVVLTDVSFVDSLPLCGSVEDIVFLLRQDLPARPASLTFVLTDGLVFESVQDEITRAVYSLGVASFKYSWGGNRVTVLDIDYYENCCFAETEEDAAAFMRSIRENGKSDMRIYCTESLYDSLVSDNASAFFAMLKQTGFAEYSVFHNDNNRMIGAENLR